MSIITELSLVELESVEDNVRGYTFINLNKHLKDSFNEYVFYITENELNLPRKEKNKLGIHFILKKIIQICSSTKNKKWFFYQVTEEKDIEYTLIKRIFGSLPSNITLSDDNFDAFINNRDYISFKNIDATQVSFCKFRQFLKRYELQALEREFLNNKNIKLSLLP